MATKKSKPAKSTKDHGKVKIAAARDGVEKPKRGKERK